MIKVFNKHNKEIRTKLDCCESQSPCWMAMHKFALGYLTENDFIGNYFPIVLIKEETVQWREENFVLTERYIKEQSCVRRRID